MKLVGHDIEAGQGLNGKGKLMTKWNVEEIDRLNEGYLNGLTREALCKMLPNRTKSAIAHKVICLGLHRDGWIREEKWKLRQHNSHKGKHYSPNTQFTSKGVVNLWETHKLQGKWTEAEEELLRIYYPTIKSRRELTELLPNYNQQAIRYKAHKLGLRRQFLFEEVLNHAKQIRNTSQYKEKMIKILHRRPNELEKVLIALIKRHDLPFKYVGAGEVIFGGKCPDFINTNGKKQLIELFGIHWHPIFDVAKRTEHFRQYGFNTLIIWEDELKDKEATVNKIKTFARKR